MAIDNKVPQEEDCEDYVSMFEQHTSDKQQTSNQLICYPSSGDIIGTPVSQRPPLAVEGYSISSFAEWRSQLSLLRGHEGASRLALAQDL